MATKPIIPMKLYHILLTLTLAASALTAQAQTDNVTRSKSAATTAKPAPKPSAKSPTRTTAKPDSKPAGKTPTAESTGLNFTVTGPNTCAVDECPEETGGNIIIPKAVIINGKVYNVTEIGKSAFSDCAELKSVEIPSSVTTIGQEAFSLCSKLVYINIPASVTEIGGRAFSHCESLRSITLPQGLQTIHDALFSCCKELTSIEIPSSVTEIEGSPFSGSGITTLNIPASVTKMCTEGHEVMFFGVNLATINVDKDNPQYCSIDGVLFDKSMTRLILYPCNKPGSSYIVRDGVNTIGPSAFMNSNLISINLPNSVINIGALGLDCKNLKSVNIPSGVTFIGDGALVGCKNISSINCLATYPPTLGNNVSIPNAITIHVPRGSGDAYRNAEFWSKHTIVDDL